MKKTAICLLLCAAMLLATGCSLLNREYSSVKPHSATYYESDNSSVLRAETYQDLVNDLLVLVGGWKEEGTIWLYATDPELTVEETVEKACAEVQMETPMGAYVVDYMTYDVEEDGHAYSAVTVNIGYRRTPEQAAAMLRTTSVNALYSLLTTAVENGTTEFVIQVGYYDDQESEVMDVATKVHREHPTVGAGRWTVNFYPNPENAGIIEVLIGETED